MDEIRPVRPEKIAEKLKAIRNLEIPEFSEALEKRPRIVEILWFIQWKSMQPGGLRKFAEELLQAFPNHIGTKTLRDAGTKALTYHQKRAIYGELPEEVSAGICYLQKETIWDKIRDDYRPINQVKVERDLQVALKDWDRERLYDKCRRHAARNLPRKLLDLCESFEKEAGEFSGIWSFEDLVDCLMLFMDRHQEQTLKRIASTAVTEKVFDALDYANNERAMVMIEGDSRFGKTEAVKAWCDSRPGRARLVSVPSSNNMAELLKRVADALGMQHSYKSTVLELKSKVEFVIRHAGIFLVADESAFLLPQTYSKTSAPVRLNWVRTEIVDQGLPFAMVVTVQVRTDAAGNVMERVSSFRREADKFVRKTSYVMEQFSGRLLTISLPQELDEKDLLAVAKIHFPEMGDDYLGYIAAQAMLSENYLKAVEQIAKRARHFAKRDSRKVALKDLDQAISEVIPTTARADQSLLQVNLEHPRRRGLKAPRSERLKAPLMGTSPVVNSRLNTPGTSLDLQTGSLSRQDAGSRIPELVSADS